jgi:DHA1 family tetracycline resistance protein-like MFS transporter
MSLRKRFSNNPLAVIFFTVFVDMLGYGILIPIIPLVLADPNSPFYLLSSKISLQSGYILLGFLLAIYPVMQFIAAPIIGQLSDRYGRRKLLILSLAGTCFSYILFAIGIITRNIPLLFVSRALDGITGGNISVAQAAIADVTDPKHRAKNFGLIGAAFGLGFILGPFLGGKLSDPSFISWFNAATPFWFAAALSFSNVMSVVFLFPETLKKLNHEVRIRWSKSVANIFKAYSIGNLRNLFITAFLFQAGFAFFVSFSGVFLIEKFGFNQGNIGDFFAFIGLWIAFTQVVLTRKLASKFEEYKILRVSLFATGLAIFVYFFPTMWWGLYLIAPVFAIFNGLTQVHLVALISRSAGPEVQGEVLGLNSSVQALAQAIPPALSGYIAATITPETPMLVSAAMIILSGLVFWILYKPTLHKDLN